ncbi:layilin [Gracilinanus agilis]|uniref:layilin n=1 Tax=Gracilinanus agilis TaxID=191870 RepID=UPI001CFEE33A|nr:layilin [Gracilinanus agilis]
MVTSGLVSEGVRRNWATIAQPAQIYIHGQMAAHPHFGKTALPSFDSKKEGKGDKIEPVTPTSPERYLKEDTNGTVKETKGADLNLAYILIPTIPLFLLLVVTTVICWLWICGRRKREQAESAKEPNIWPPPHRRNSPDLEVYNVIRKQSEADLTEPRPDLQNISFRGRSGGAAPNDLSCDYDNVVVSAPESGLVTLASMESGFVANDIYELSPERMGRNKESGWVENEIYGY